VERVSRRSPVAGHSALIVDYTGVDLPVVDALRQRGLKLQVVALHGGDSVSHVGANWRVPKRDLVGVVQVLLQQRRLQFAAQLALTATLTRELLDFRVKIDPTTAHDSYSAWHEKDHDDLVLALALAMWWGERQAATTVPPLDMSRALRGLTKPVLGSPGMRERRVFRGDLTWDEDL
jgi:hypothetical protein